MRWIDKNGMDRYTERGVHNRYSRIHTLSIRTSKLVGCPMLGRPVRRSMHRVVLTLMLASSRSRQNRYALQVHRDETWATTPSHSCTHVYNQKMKEEQNCTWERDLGSWKKAQLQCKCSRTKAALSYFNEDGTGIPM